MEYGTKEFYDMVKSLMAVVVKEGEAGLYTDEGVREDGADFLFRIVEALEPLGIRMTIQVLPIECGEDDE